MAERDIRVKGLRKGYKGGVAAVDGITFTVASGQVFGFLGPNGAGKSTTVKILTTLALPTAGEATVGGFDVVREATAVRRIAGVALQEIGIDPLMKSMELLTLQGQLFGAARRDAVARAEELLQLVQLTDAIDRRVGTYSGGMRRRLDLALALVHRPQILFLDEPTTGLDPASRRDVWREVRRLNREFGMTIFLTTQYLEEADELADVVAIIDKGQIVAEGAPAALKAEMGTEAINLKFSDRQQAQAAREKLTALSADIQLDQQMVRLYINQAAQQVPVVVQRLQAADLHPHELTLTQPTLDDVFLKVTGERLQADKVAAI